MKSQSLARWRIRSARGLLIRFAGRVSFHKEVI
jgi:hypothetical protein